jgi:NAD(P)-dependent dehydrogenase (short-subunit alcohol dehydrogenase family)
VDGGDIAGRVVIVTGAGQGIGRGIAHRLAKNGAAVVVAERKPHRVERVVGELDDLGADALGVETDILDRASIEGMVRATIDRFGRVDALVNNAHTFTSHTPLAEATTEDVDVNHGTTKGVLWAMQAVRPHMASAGWGRIVNLVSAAGITGMAGYGPYNAAKEAIRALTRTAAREWGRDGIVVNAVAPGAASKRGQAALARAETEQRPLLTERAIDRLGDPEEDIAPVVLFLCSDACRYLTGQTLMVDGGAFLFA